MMSIFVTLDQNQNPTAVQKFDSAPGIDIVTPPNTIYIQDASPYTDQDILNNWRMVDGVLTNVGPNPGSEYIWSVTQKQWVADLPRAKSLKIEEINKARNQAEFGGFEWDNHIFDSNIASQMRLQNAVQLASNSKTSNTPFSISWTLKDNTSVELTADNVLSVGLALANHVTNIHQISKNLKQQVQNATTVEQIKSITWPTPPFIME